MMFILSSVFKNIKPLYFIQVLHREEWSEEEVTAVEKMLNAFIRSRKVPGKDECENCIKASPQALQGRSWTAVKFYVKNRIDADKRKK